MSTLTTVPRRSRWWAYADTAQSFTKLNGEDCSPICDYLSRRGIPFAFYTGYREAPNGWANAPIITKPAHHAQIVEAVAALCNGRIECEAT